MADFGHGIKLLMLPVRKCSHLFFPGLAKKCFLPPFSSSIVPSLEGFQKLRVLTCYFDINILEITFKSF